MACIFKRRLKEHQKLAIKFIAENKHVLLAYGTGSGKALIKDTKIITQRGFVPIEELTLQDKVYDKDWNLCDILGIFFQGKKQLFKLKFSDSSFEICCMEHLWLVHEFSSNDFSTEGSIVVRNTLYMAENFDKHIFALPPVNHPTRSFDKKYLIAIEYFGEEEAYCLSVDSPSHTYVTSNYNVTHNTTISISTSKLLLHRDLVDLCIIVTKPKGLIPLEAECKQFLDGYQRVKDSDDSCISRLQKYSGILICNYGKVPKVIKHVLKYQKSFSVFFDECHTIKNPSVKVTKNAKKLRNLALYSIGMTGTPITRDIEDCYNLVSFFNPSLLGTYKNFLDNFTVYYTLKLKTRNGFEFPKYNPTKFKNLNRLSQLLSSTVLSYFPQYNTTYKVVNVPLQDRTLYNCLVKEAIADCPMFGDKPPDTFIRLQKYLNKRKEKIKALLGLIKEYLPEGVIIYVDMYEDLDILENIFRLKDINFRAFTGRCTEKQGKDIQDWFVSNPKNKVLFITQAGGQSLNLQCVKRLILYSIPFSIGAFLQIIGRITREDSKFGDFFIYLLLTENSIEMYKYTFIQMFTEVYKVLFGNTALTKMSKIPNMNRYILQKLAKEFVWSKKS